MVAFNNSHSRSGSSDSDELLVNLARRGDAMAFEELLRRHKQSVLRLALRFVDRPEDAQDVSQETWMAVHLHLPQFRGECSFRTWLWSIARSKGLLHRRLAGTSAIDLARAERNEQPASIDVLASQTQSPESQAATSELDVLTRAALRDLKPKYRHSFYLWAIEGFTLTEIAASAGISYAAAKIRLFRARAILRERVQKTLSRRGRVNRRRVICRAPSGRGG